MRFLKLLYGLSNYGFNSFDVLIARLSHLTLFSYSKAIFLNLIPVRFLKLLYRSSNYGKRLFFSISLGGICLSSWGAFIPKSFIATFEQKYQSRLSKKWKSSRGELKYLFPGNIKLEVTYPEKELVISNPEKTWIYTPPFIEGEKGQVVIKSTKTFGPAKFFDFLREGLVSTSNYRVVLKKKAAYLVFSKKLQKDLGIKSATLIFKSKQKHFLDLSQVHFLLTSGKEKRLELKTIKVTSTLTSKDFSFIVPPNTLIQH